ncbi:protein FAR1-RELATED SEQUENCE 1-like [Ipomoea triloba]|uniref:protein FAR1-RELATED SEQUENCE 1-like n=1 Tax=Ipomoea triloba TaxID=35885 RepID=UPI00125E7738|nr:protein FAR1-RELATED SEQUENCE 1-like [Ipomoea triloba]
MCLVEFFYQFERTINRQRSKQAELDAACNGHLPALKTPLIVERETSSIYTLAIFYQLQGEIIGACFTCRVRSFADSEPTRTYVIEDDKGKSYTVVVENGSNNISCTCRMYRRIGLLCRHAFVVLKDERFDHIPPQHITPHWTRDVVPKTRRDPYAGTQAEDLRNAAKSMEETQVINTFYKCLGIANGRVEKLQQIAHTLEGVETSISGDKDSGEANLGKRATMETYSGILAPETIVVHPPQVSKNKGSGKRIKSMKEIAIKGMRKKGRTCATCGLANGHNSRTCLKR